MHKLKVDIVTIPNKTMREMIDAQMANPYPRLNEVDLMPFKRETKLLATYGVMAMIRQGSGMFYLIHGRYPESWEELAATGLCGVNTKSLCPLSGFALDGRKKPNSIKIKKSSAGNGLFMTVTDANGEKFPANIFY